MDYREYATQAHKDQTYGNSSYTDHLIHVENTLICNRFDTEFWRTCAWLHDIIEDTEVTYEDIELRFGQRVADTVLSVSGFGKNRKEKQASILSSLEAYPLGCILKCADRIANVASGWDGYNHCDEKPDKLIMYYKEHSNFATVVQPIVPISMWHHLNNMVMAVKYKGLVK